MKKSLCPLLLLLIVACNAPAPETKTEDDVIVTADTIASADPTSDTLAATDNNQVVHNESQVSDYEEDTLHMIGDFYGDDGPDSAFLVVVEDKIAKKRKQTGDSTNNEDEEALSPYYELHFHGKGAPKFRPIGRADVNISNEGDLDGDGKEDVSVIWLKPLGEESWNEIYACKKGKWVLIQKLEYVRASATVSNVHKSTSSFNQHASFGNSSFHRSRRSFLLSRKRSGRR